MIVFAADGSESTIDDGAGETITAGYTAGLLTSLTASSGAFLHMTYNGAGRIVAVTSSTGETATYSYDATNTYLTGVTGPGGTLIYTYTPATGSLTDNALLSVQYADGKQDLYGYDSLGELGSFLSGYTVTGQVSDGSGNPIAAATVTLYSEANPQSQFMTTTRSDGSYQIQGVPVGTYDVVVLVNGFEARITTGVTVAGPTSNGPSILAASTTTLTGTVVDPTGQSIAAATVKVVDSAGRTIGTAVSAADGTFVITTASGNNLTLQIFVPGSNTPKQQTISIPEGTTVQLGQIDPGPLEWIAKLGVEELEERSQRRTGPRSSTDQCVLCSCLGQSRECHLRYRRAAGMTYDQAFISRWYNKQKLMRGGRCCKSPLPLGTRLSCIWAIGSRRSS